MLKLAQIFEVGVTDLKALSRFKVALKTIWGRVYFRVYDKVSIKENMP